jgi:hypothetical protein
MIDSDNAENDFEHARQTYYHDLLATRDQKLLKT